MTPREKILRDEIMYVIKEINKIDPIMETETIRAMVSRLEISLLNADAIKDGPSEEDRARVKRMETQGYSVYRQWKDRVSLGEDFDWMVSELKKYMGIE